MKINQNIVKNHRLITSKFDQLIQENQKLRQQRLNSRFKPLQVDNNNNDNDNDNDMDMTSLPPIPIDDGLNHYPLMIKIVIINTITFQIPI